MKLNGEDPSLRNLFLLFVNIDGRYIPRAACLDLEPGSIDSLRSSKYGGLFSPDNCICGEFLVNDYVRDYGVICQNTEISSNKYLNLNINKMA